MTKRTKDLFEALYLLRYAASHETNEINDDEIQDAYYKILDILASIKYAEEQEELTNRIRQEQENKVNLAHKKIKENFQELGGAVEIANDISKRLNKYNINITYIISELSNGTIAIIDSKSDPNNKKILRIYDDKLDYLCNIDEDLKVDFKRDKLFSGIKKLSPNKDENKEN